jgi:hypothetical protein
MDYFKLLLPLFLYSVLVDNMYIIVTIAAVLSLGGELLL